jgi:serine/threonine protein kinase, bacterial
MRDALAVQVAQQAGVGAENVCVTDNSSNQVHKLSAGSNSPVKPPFTGLKDPLGVAVDAAGNLYVAENGSNQVLKLLAR